MATETELLTREEEESGHKRACLERRAQDGEDTREGHLETFEGDRRQCFPEEEEEAEGEEAEDEEQEEQERFWRSVLSEQ